ncbi:Uncharacterised protein [Sphingobacterium daejeonense]|nr:Uncharacterised protein [Sphingobacterium daejeonense]
MKIVKVGQLPLNGYEYIELKSKTRLGLHLPRFLLGVVLINYL